MNKNIRSGVQLAVHGAMAMASLTSTAVLAQDGTVPAPRSAAQLNQASLTSVEQSYLKIPRLCKARTAAFDPIVVGRETVPASVTAIHAALDASALEIA
jgi:hypothetical protein